MSGPRSSQAGVRNPVVNLPSAYLLKSMPPEVRRALRQIFREISAQSRINANTAWKKHKGPMAAYWKACAVYARHIGVVLK